MLDKDAAGKPKRQRPTEAILRLLDVLGGWPGALIEQQQMRHKTVKASFWMIRFWISVFANLALVAWLWRSGVAAALTDVVIG